MALAPYQQEFINFLVQSEALSFGDFITKSGRSTPYFINTGRFNDGARIQSLGQYYAQHIVNQLKTKIDVIFGPAYKGIPLAVASAYALQQEHGLNVGFCFDRKEDKAHGDGGRFVGTSITAGMRVIIVEDVITAGTTLKRIVPLISSTLKAKIEHVFIAVDRNEKGSGESSAVSEIEDELKVKIHPIVTVPQIVEYLSSPNSSDFQISADVSKSIRAYRDQYGA